MQVSQSVVNLSAVDFHTGAANSLSHFRRLHYYCTLWLQYLNPLLPTPISITQYLLFSYGSSYNIECVVPVVVPSATIASLIYHSSFSNFPTNTSPFPFLPIRFPLLPSTTFSQALDILDTCNPTFSCSSRSIFLLPYPSRRSFHTPPSSRTITDNYLGSKHPVNGRLATPQRCMLQDLSSYLKLQLYRPSFLFCLAHLLITVLLQAHLRLRYRIQLGN